METDVIDGLNVLDFAAEQAAADPEIFLEVVDFEQMGRHGAAGTVDLRLRIQAGGLLQERSSAAPACQHAVQ